MKLNVWSLYGGVYYHDLYSTDNQYWLVASVSEEGCDEVFDLELPFPSFQTAYNFLTAMKKPPQTYYTGGD